MNNSTTQQTVSNLVDHDYSNFLYFMIVVNSLSSILTAVLNFLVILTFAKTASLRTPSYIFILSLAISDLGIGVVTQPASCIRHIFWLTKNHSLYQTSLNIVIRTFSMLVTSSLLTVTAITIDRFLALHLHLRYQELVTTKRSYIVVITIWVFSLLWSFIYAIDRNWVYIIDYSFTSAVIILDVYLMLRISRGIRRHIEQIHVQQHPQQPTMNMQRYKRSVRTMYYITGVFLVCYLPYMVVGLLYHVLKEVGISMGIEMYYAFQLVYGIVMMNSALNPLIYCWRIVEIRNALLQVLRRQ